MSASLSAERGAAHGALQLVPRIEQSGRVEDDHLRRRRSVRMPTTRSRVDCGLSLTMAELLAR